MRQRSQPGVLVADQKSEQCLFFTTSRLQLCVRPVKTDDAQAIGFRRDANRGRTSRDFLADDGRKPHRWGTLLSP